MTIGALATVNSFRPRYRLGTIFYPPGVAFVGSGTSDKLSVQRSTQIRDVDSRCAFLRVTTIDDDNFQGPLLRMREGPLGHWE